MGKTKVINKKKNIGIFFLTTVFSAIVISLVFGLLMFRVSKEIIWLLVVGCSSLATIFYGAIVYYFSRANLLYIVLGYLAGWVLLLLGVFSYLQISAELDYRNSLTYTSKMNDMIRAEYPSVSIGEVSVIQEKHSSGRFTEVVLTVPILVSEPVHALTVERAFRINDFPVVAETSNPDIVCLHFWDPAYSPNVLLYEVMPSGYRSIVTHNYADGGHIISPDNQDTYIFQARSDKVFYNDKYCGDAVSLSEALNYEYRLEKLPLEKVLLQTPERR